MSRVEIYKQGWDFLRRLLGEPLDKKEQLLVAGVNELFNKITASETSLDEASDKVTNEALDKADTSLGEASDKVTNEALDKESHTSVDKEAQGTFDSLELLTDIETTFSTQRPLDDLKSLEISAVSALDDLKNSIGPGYEFTVRVVEHNTMDRSILTSPFLVVQDVPSGLNSSFEFKELQFQVIDEHGMGLRYIGSKPIKQNTFVLATKGRYVTKSQAKQLPDHRYLIEARDGRHFLMDETFCPDNGCLLINHSNETTKLNCGFWFRFGQYSPRRIPPNAICVDKQRNFYVDLEYPYFAKKFPVDIALHQPMVYAFALRDIKPNENLYLDYGERFWNEQ